MRTAGGVHLHPAARVPQRGPTSAPTRAQVRPLPGRAAVSCGRRGLVSVTGRVPMDDATPRPAHRRRLVAGRGAVSASRGPRAWAWLPRAGRVALPRRRTSLASRSVARLRHRRRWLGARPGRDRRRRPPPGTATPAVDEAVALASAPARARGSTTRTDQLDAMIVPTGEVSPGPAHPPGQAAHPTARQRPRRTPPSPRRRCTGAASAARGRP